MLRNSSQIGAIEISTIAAIIITAAIVGAVSVVATIKYYENLSISTPVAAITSKMTPSATSTPLINETADWQTYTSEEFGFEVKYPKRWFVRENTSYDAISRKEVLRKCREEDPIDLNAPLGRQMGKFTLESQDYPADFGYMGYLPSVYPGGLILEISIECNKTIPQNKNLFLSKNADIGIDPQTIWKVYNANHNGLYYFFYMSIFPEQNIINQEKGKLAEDSLFMFNQILSTFKFTK